MILFKSLKFANFLAVGNQPVTIDLNNNKTTLIHGVNGSGKSTILDALCYSLFGKSFRGVNLSQLINTQNKKGLRVEVEFSIGSTDFLVRRGMKPKIFEVYRNGEALDTKAADRDNQQYLEQNILKLTYKSFTQIVILGSSNFIPFMQLTSAGRRECVEDFLDIKVFSTMAVMAKERLRGLKENQRILDSEYGALYFKVDTLEDKIKSMNQRDEAEIDKYRSQIKKCRHDIANVETILAQLYKKHKKLSEESDEIESKGADRQVRDLNNVIIKLNTKLERLVKERDFFDQDECPTCGQGIEYALKTGAQGRILMEMEKVDAASLQAKSLMDKQQSFVDDLLKINKTMRDYSEKIFELQTELKSYQQEIKNCEDCISTLKELSVDTEQEQAILDSLRKDLDKMDRDRADLKEKVANHEVVASLLKDSGIKTQIVKNYLPAMNKFIRYYLNELDFPVQFQLDSEFSETVMSPLHQDFSYQSFSEGQKGRIDLALMFTWREIGRLKNSVSTNILILDEVFSSSLDEVGKECLLQLLRFKIPDNQRVVVVDHTLNDSFKDKFDTCIEVTRVNGFSRYA